MGDRLFVAVLGNRNSGKSITWNKMFGRTVRTGNQERKLELLSGEFVDVFLVSGSFEERNLYAGDVLEDQDCRIVLCSIQYTDEVARTLNYVRSKGFDLCVHWLNPGYDDGGETWDRLGLVNQILADNSSVAIRSGKISPSGRVQELKEFIYGWASFRQLVY